MTLWIGNGAVLKSSSQWQLNEFWKLNNSGRENSKYFFGGKENIVGKRESASYQHFLFVHNVFQITTPQQLLKNIV